MNPNLKLFQCFFIEIYKMNLIKSYCVQYIDIEKQLSKVNCIYAELFQNFHTAILQIKLTSFLT